MTLTSPVMGVAGGFKRRGAGCCPISSRLQVHLSNLPRSFHMRKPCAAMLENHAPHGVLQVNQHRVTHEILELRLDRRHGLTNVLEYPLGK